MNDTKISCTLCRKVIKHKQFLKCSRCKLIYDLKCTNKEKLYYLMDNTRKANWICDNCGRKRVSKNNNSITSTPEPSSKPAVILRSQDKQNKVIKEKKHIESNTALSTTTILAQMDLPMNENVDNITYRRKQITTAAIPTSNSFDSLQTDPDELEDVDVSGITPQKLNRSCPNILVKSHLDHEALQMKLDHLQQKYESAEHQVELLLSENFSLKKTIEEYKFKMSNLTSMYKDTEHLSASKSKCDSVKKSSKKNKKRNNDSYTEFITTHLSPPLENSTIKHQEDFKEYPSQKKLCIISANEHNKILNLAMRTFQDEYQLCHYKLPHRGVLDTLDSIDEKTKSLTNDDYCVVMVGEKDFRTSQNYYTLVKNIRNKLISLNHTNIIICLPTFKCHGLAQLYNRRIEIFNKLLYLDLQKHEYAFILDSNRYLEYDYRMFNGPQGALNNRGMANVISNLNNLINDIQSYNSGHGLHNSSETSQMENFFRA